MKRYIQTIGLGIVVTLITGCYRFNDPTTPHLFSPHASDNAITTSILQAYINHPLLSQAPIHVDTHQGTVLLTGHVKTIRQSDTALDIAIKTPGVHGVDNKIVIKK